jgi:hypothetical protein
MTLHENDSSFACLRHNELMKLFLSVFLLFINLSCAHQKPQTPVEDDDVSVDVALDQAQMSYLKGCVDGRKALSSQKSFNVCKDMAIKHRQEINFILNSPIEF